MKLNNKKGISLIVLVITIAVMIVLAAIILSLQSSGVIERANEAKIKNDIASAKELVAVANSEWLLMTETNQEQNGGDFVTYAETKLNEAGYDANDYVINEEGNVEKCVAIIGEQKFIELADAIYSIQDNTETIITIVNDINVDNTISITRGRKIILDVNGHTITSRGIAILTNAGNLTIKDTSELGTGKIESIVDEDKHAKYDATFDFDSDGYITKAEANKLVRHTSGIETIKDEALLARCDVNGDGIVNADDVALLVSKYVSVDYAIYNSITLVIDETMEGKISGKPAAVHEN